MPASAIFTGHDACADCHRPHDFSRAGARACTDCHGELGQLGDDVTEHQRCTSCHDPHRPRAAGEDRCISCHGGVSPDYPASARGHKCLGCHPTHPRAPLAAGVAVPCSTCHGVAASDTALHAGGIACSVCHEPHATGATSATAALCGRCHPAAAVASRSSLFTGVGGGFVVARALRRRRRQWLEIHGTRIEARFTGVERDTTLTVNGRSPWRLTCQWQHPYTREVHVFASDHLWYDPGEYVNRETLEVLIDPQHPGRYHVNTEFLPRQTS